MDVQHVEHSQIVTVNILLKRVCGEAVQCIFFQVDGLVRAAGPF